VTAFATSPVHATYAVAAVCARACLNSAIFAPSQVEAMMLNP
jgi:hypothetical protein